MLTFAVPVAPAPLESLTPFPSNPVYGLGAHERERCCVCERGGNASLYGRGEAYLAGPGHTPRDGEAHIVCTKHLDPDATVIEGIRLD